MATLSKTLLADLHHIMPFLAAASFCWFGFGARAEQYTITRFAIPPGANYVIPSSINDSGAVTGYYGAGNGTDRAFVWTSGSGYAEIASPFAGQGAFGVSINSAGNVAGTRGTEGFVWSESDGEALLSKAGSSYASVYDINDAGDVAGYVGAGGAAYPVLWDASNNVTFLQPGAEGQTLAVNESRMAVGYIGRFDSKGFVWSETTGLQELPLLNATAMTLPLAINDYGVVVGASGDSAFNLTGNTAFLWTTTGGLQNLGWLPGSGARDINNLNVVVGSEGSGSTKVAVIWDELNGKRYLDDLGNFSGWALQEALGVNDAGQIIGRGLYGSQPAAFVLTPVPEPSSWAL